MNSRHKKRNKEGVNQVKKCPNCQDKINPKGVVIKTIDGVKVCSNWCKDDWNLLVNSK